MLFQGDVPEAKSLAGIARTRKVIVSSFTVKMAAMTGHRSLEYVGETRIIDL